MTRLIRHTALIALLGASGGELIAADYKKNPYTLAYDGAISKNEPGRVNIHPVSYKLNGLDISANVYTPANFDPKGKYPTIVVAHPNGGVKEQVAGLYAQRLAEMGYVTIAADAAYQGASGGAVMYSGDANLSDEQIAKLPFDLYRQGYEYYWKTHAHPNATFKYTTSSLIDLMRFDATNQIELIQQPLLMIAGTRADSLYMTEDAFAKATGAKDKELFKLDGATHIETYWVPKYVSAALVKLNAFYIRTL